MTPSEQRDHMQAAERVFAQRIGATPERTHAFGNLARPELRKGDWLIIGVFAVERAVAIDQHPVCVNLVTGERKIVKNWAAANALQAAISD